MTPILAVSDPVWQTIIAGVVTIVLGWLTKQNTNAVKQAGSDAKNAVAATTDRLDNLTGVAETTHILVNGAHGQLLLVNASNTRRIAVITKDPADIIAADLAQRVANDHMAKLAAITPPSSPTSL